MPQGGACRRENGTGMPFRSGKTDAPVSSEAPKRVYKTEADPRSGMEISRLPADEECYE